MRLTNIHGLPDPLVKAVSNDKYDPGRSDYTTSQLAGTPARQLVLKRRHWHELSEDVSERIYALSGQSKHVVLERAAELCDEYEYLAEKRFYIERHGKTIGGQIDLLHDRASGTLYDWKEVSVWVSKQELKEEWIRQGNINKLILEENGFQIAQLINIALYRDWRKAQAEKTKDYPPYQVEAFPLPVWDRIETETFISARINQFETAKEVLPECSESERWYSGDKFALIKTGNKKATKLFDTQKEAADHQEIFNMVNGYDLQFRPGVNKRCALGYCVVAKHCDQYQKLKENENGTESDPATA